MKKTIFFLILFVSNITYGQLLTVTQSGLKDVNENDKSYVVIQVKDKSAKELYNQSINYINKFYKNPDVVIKGKIDGEYLRFNTYARSITTMKNVIARTYIDAKYTTELSFKDGKIKFEIIDIQLLVEGRNPIYFVGSGISSFYIFNTKGKLERADAKSGIEAYFNGKILELSMYLESLEKAEEEW